MVLLATVGIVEVLVEGDRLHDEGDVEPARREDNGVPLEGDEGEDELVDIFVEGGLLRENGSDVRGDPRRPGVQIADEVLAMGCKMTTLKSGHRGFYIETKSKDAFEEMGEARPADLDNWSKRELWTPAFEVADFGSATGSGDSSIAGLLSAFLRGLTIEDALKYATCCGLQNVRVLDAISGIKSWHETTGMIEQDMPMINANIETNGWKWSEDYAKTNLGCGTIIGGRSTSCPSYGCHRASDGLRWSTKEIWGF